MNSTPSLNRWLAAGLTVAIFGAVLAVFNWPRPDATSPADAAQPAKAAEQAKSDPNGWTMFGGGPTRNMACLTAKNLPVTWSVDDPKSNVLWSADLGSRAYGGPTVAAGKVFIGTNNNDPRDKKYTKTVEGKTVSIDLGVLMAFEQTSGKFAYQSVFEKLTAGRVVDWPEEGLCSTPTVEGDRMYYTSNRCEVVCAKVDTGDFVWRLDMIKELGVFPHNLTCCSPLLVGDYLYVITANGVDEGHLNVPAPNAPTFIKVAKKDGKVLWRDNSPTVKLTQVDKTNQVDVFKTLVNRGELIQHGQWSNASYAVVAGQPQVVFPAGDGWIYSFDPDGKLLWRFDCNPKDAAYELGSKGARSDFIATPVIYKNKVYIGTGQDPEHETGVGHLWCIDMINKGGDVSPDLVTDATVWPPKTKPNPNSAKVWHYGGLIRAEDKAKFTRNYYFGRTMSTCAIHDDLVYAADLSGFIHCLDAKTGQVYWEHDTGNNTWSSPYWADNKVYLGTDGGELWVFAHGKDKKVLGKGELNGGKIRATAVAVGDVLYVISGNQLFALANKK